MSEKDKKVKRKWSIVEQLCFITFFLFPVLCCAFGIGMRSNLVGIDVQQNGESAVAEYLYMYGTSSTGGVGWECFYKYVHDDGTIYYVNRKNYTNMSREEMLAIVEGTSIKIRIDGEGYAVQDETETTFGWSNLVMIIILPILLTGTIVLFIFKRKKNIKKWSEEQLLEMELAAGLELEVKLQEDAEIELEAKIKKEQQLIELQNRKKQSKSEQSHKKEYRRK